MTINTYIWRALSLVAHYQLTRIDLSRVYTVVNREPIRL
jgi:hypothetical protein